MKKNITFKLQFLLFTGFLFFSCETDVFDTSGSAKLVFSSDTVMFDTVFTTIGSATQSFRVINPSFETVKIASIKLAGGNRSRYRLNIDGEMVNEAHNIELRGKDSLYIFVEVTIDPNGVNQPVIVHDSIVFSINGLVQDVDLVAYGQDVVLIKQGVINTTTWTADKPYLIYDYAYVDTLQTLTIEPGTRIFMHDSAGFYACGNIIAKGTPENPIIFEGDRLEEWYKNKPGQWGMVMLFPNPVQSVFENVEIRNSLVGMQVGYVYYNGGANVKLHNVKIEHVAYYGIYAVRSKIEATNTLVADCGNECVYLVVGGEYEFTHCTIANYWNYTTRQFSALFISNQWRPDPSQKWITGDLIKANFNNSIIYGNFSGSELYLSQSNEKAFNFNFDHCLVKMSDSLYAVNAGHFNTIMRNADSLFVNYSEYNFMPDSLSPVRGYGLRSYAEKVPLDIANVSRLGDEDGPDIGAFEFIRSSNE